MSAITKISFHSSRIAILALCLAISHAANLRCDYGFNDLQDYQCKGVMTTTKKDYFVDTLEGNHRNMFGNDDVISVSFEDASLEVFPGNLNSWFRNFRYLQLYNITSLPNLERSQFYNFNELQGFIAKGLPSINVLPKDTFWDLTELKALIFHDNRNMGNLDKDFLINAPSLNLFGVMGSPKFTTIPAGFFRSQLKSLEVVSFRESGLKSISYTTFVGMRVLKIAGFEDAGCLNFNYEKTLLSLLTPDIRKNCQDASINQNLLNLITKKINKDYGTSSSVEEDEEEE